MAWHRPASGSKLHFSLFTQSSLHCVNNNTKGIKNIFSELFIIYNRHQVN